MKRARGNRINRKGNDEWDIWRPFFVVALLLRLLVTLSPAYGIDMGGYVAWSRYLAQTGPVGFYDAFHVVYAPLFHYCLWITGEWARLFGASWDTHAYAIKLWSVAADAAGAFLLIRHAARVNRLRTGHALGLLHFMNPAVLFNSSVWGQFDGVPATLLLAVVLLFEGKRPVPAALVFLAAVLIKPQSALLAPLAGVAFVRETCTRPWKQALLVWMAALGGGIALYLAVVLPFYAPTPLAGTIPAWLDPFWWLFDLYLRSVRDYPYGTANAWNLWFLLGGQIRPDSTIFFGLPHSAWGLLLLAPFAGLCVWTYLRAARHPAALPLSSWLLLFAAYLLMTKMHERYLVPALLIGTFCVFSDKRFLWPLLLASATSFFNQLVLYRLSFSGTYWLPSADPPSLAGSAVMTAAFVWTCVLFATSMNLKGRSFMERRSMT